MLLRLCSIVLFAGALGGCSLVFTSGPPPEAERQAAFTCTATPIAPLLDLAWVGYALAATAAEKRGGIGAGDIALSTLWVGSAAYGVWNVTRCRSAIEEAERRAVEASRPSAPLH